MTHGHHKDNDDNHSDDDGGAGRVLLQALEYVLLVLEYVRVLPGLQDQADLLLDVAAEAVDGRLGQVLVENAEDSVGPPKDGLPQLSRLLQLFTQLLLLLC